MKKKKNEKKNEKKRDGNHYAPLFIVLSKSEQVEGGQDPVYFFWKKFDREKFESVITKI